MVSDRTANVIHIRRDLQLLERIHGVIGAILSDGRLTIQVGSREAFDSFWQDDEEVVIDRDFHVNYAQYSKQHHGVTIVYLELKTEKEIDDNGF